MKALTLALLPLNLILIAYLIYPVIRLEARKTSVLRSIVMVFGVNIQGTGAIIRYRGNRYILTNNHICDQEMRKTIEFGGVYIGGYKVLKTDPIRDLCLIEGPVAGPRRPLKGMQALALAQGYQLGETIISGGYPEGQGPVVVTGILFYHDKVQYPTHIISPGEECPKGTHLNPHDPRLCLWTGDIVMSTLVVAPGQSGSPVVNIDGELVAIIVGHSGDFGILITLDTIKEFLESVEGKDQRTADQN